MEKLGELPANANGEPFGESYKGVNGPQHLFSLYRNAIAFVGNPDISANELVRIFEDIDFTLDDGTSFKREHDNQGGYSAIFEKGARKAEVLIYEESGVACVFKWDFSGKPQT